MTNYERLNDESMVSTLEKLQHDKKLTKERLKVAQSDAGKIVIKELEASLEAVRAEYISIQTHMHTNIVATNLAKIQGREKEISFQLKLWTTAKNLYKDIDNEISKCEKALVERTANNQKRRI